MARYNEILTGRHNRFFQKIFGMKGPASVAQLASDVQPVHPIFHGSENRYLESWNKFGVSVVVGPSVGNNNAVRFRNPSNSGSIAVLEGFTYTNTQNDTCRVTRATTGVDLTNQFLSTPLDTRFKTAGGSSLILSSFSPGIELAFPVAYRGAPAVQPVDFLPSQTEWTILPGDCYHFNGFLVNSTAIFSFLWRERALEDSER